MTKGNIWFAKLVGLIPLWFLLPTAVQWIYSFAYIGLLFYNIKIQNKCSYTKSNPYSIIWAFIIYISIINLYGIAVAENYWEYKALITNLPKYYSIAITIWVSTYFNIFILYRKSFYMLLLAAITCFLISKSYSFIYSLAFAFPIFLLLKAKSGQFRIKDYIVFALYLLCIFTYSSIQRIDILKILFVLVSFIFVKKLLLLNANRLKYIAFSFLLLPFVLFYTGVTGIFNPFQMEDYIKGDYSTTRVENGELVEEELTADTRTSLYVDIFSTLDSHDSWILGRTPAKGYECAYIDFGNFYTGITERNASEVGLLNITLHYGIIGFILYSAIFIYGIWLALFRSENRHCKLMALYVSFIFFISWIWQPPQLSVFYFFDMCMLGLCYSPSFRSYTDKELSLLTKKYSLNT